MQYDVSAVTNSVYVHWPFCPYRCHYCPFVALAGQDEFMEQYHQALIQEMKHFHANQQKKCQLNTLFLGGGTPSTYPTGLLLDMLSILKDIFVFHSMTEVTIEVNPGTVQKSQIEMWQKAGINRMSVGVQSLKDGVLHDLNRMQKISDVYSLFSYAPTYIPNISIDLILGLPNVSSDEWKSYLKEVITWPIKHISIYFLTIHEDTPLYFRVEKKDIVLISDETMIDLYQWTVAFLKEAGFLHYELSNFAKPGYECKHNTVYWERKPYKGFGLGACSFDGANRLQNEKKLMKYIDLAYQKSEPVVFFEHLTNRQIYLEKMMLQLRRSCGVKWSDLTESLTEKEVNQLKEKVAFLCEKGFLIDDKTSIRLTIHGLVVENQIITQLLI
jgi:oxygen-independent coproporphyrinogen-3 oxidase